MREVNERVAELGGQTWAGPEQPLEIHCECGSFPSCEVQIRITPAAYERVRAQDDRFAVAPGHETPEIETVVERGETWVIVDKLPRYEPLVDDDPRGNPSG